MRINDHIFIYYTENNKKECILLEKYQELLKLPHENKKEILEIFKKKFFKDFIESSNFLIKKSYLYPAATLLSSSIDVLAKHYSNNTENSDISRHYKSFFKIFFTEIKEKKLIKKNFYSNFRCSLVHSNSSRKIDFSIEDDIITDITDDSGKIVINLNYLSRKIESILLRYIQMLNSDINLYNSFINVQKKLYCD